MNQKGKHIGSTSEVIEDRLDQIEKFMLRRTANHKIYQHCKENWDIEQAQADRYIADVRERWKKSQAHDMITKREASIAQLNELYDKAIEQHDRAEARKVLDLISKFEGTTAPIKIEQDITWEVTWGDTPEEEEDNG